MIAMQSGRGNLLQIVVRACALKCVLVLLSLVVSCASPSRLVSSETRYVIVAAGETIDTIADREAVDALSLMSLNRLYSDADLKVGMRLRLPRSKAEVLGDAQGLWRPTHFEFQWPLKQNQITDYFGWRKKRLHEGIDLRARTGTPVFASASGEVIYAARTIRNFGRMVVVDHGQGWSSVYAHLSKMLVRVGQHVEQGQKIGLAGRSGRASGAHLHFEIRKEADPLDPLLLLPRK